MNQFQTNIPYYCVFWEQTLNIRQNINMYNLEEWDMCRTIYVNLSN